MPMTHRPSDAVVDAWIALNRSQQVSLLEIERRFRDADLPPHAWYDALWELERAGETGLRPFEIEKQMLITQSNISRLIDRLAAKGYVERRPCEADGRGQMVVITTSGRALRKRMWPIYAKAITETVGQHFSEREAATISSLLGKLIGQT